MKRIHLTDDQIDSLIARYADGVSATYIAADMGITTTTVYAHLKRASVPLHQPQASLTSIGAPRPRRAPQRNKTPYEIVDSPIDIEPETARSMALIVCGRYVDDLQAARLVLDVLGLDRPDLVAKAPLAYVVTEHIRHHRPTPRARRIA